MYVWVHMTESDVLTSSARSVLLGFVGGGDSTLEYLVPVTVPCTVGYADWSVQCASAGPSTQVPGITAARGFVVSSRDDNCPLFSLEKFHIRRASRREQKYKTSFGRQFNGAKRGSGMAVSV
ncbi:hypothetical protein ACJ72_00875 [Emergomyces africanus]|uniref:Uncharacterized protein n=1 Tax=Emergomyces africanus TaxID=1955775 RepID=A0A1B7P6V3_9EURO|nr:hypothetical protein ACJ72_00875 [Emergomyces africanus]